MLAGYLRPGSSSIELLGLAPTSVDALRGRVGVLPQDALLPASDRVGEFSCRWRAWRWPKTGARLSASSGRDWWNERCRTPVRRIASASCSPRPFSASPKWSPLDEQRASDPRIAWGKSAKHSGQEEGALLDHHFEPQLERARRDMRCRRRHRSRAPRSLGVDGRADGYARENSEEDLSTCRRCSEGKSAPGASATRARQPSGHRPGRRSTEIIVWHSIAVAPTPKPSSEGAQALLDQQVRISGVSRRALRLWQPLRSP